MKLSRQGPAGCGAEENAVCSSLSYPHVSETQRFFPKYLIAASTLLDLPPPSSPQKSQVKAGQRATYSLPLPSAPLQAQNQRRKGKGMRADLQHQACIFTWPHCPGPEGLRAEASSTLGL